MKINIPVKPDTRTDFPNTVYQSAAAAAVFRRSKISESFEQHTIDAFFLVDIVSPQIGPFEIAEDAVNWGDSVSAVCTIVKGDSPVDIYWAINGEPVGENYRDVSITTNKRNSLLSIDSVSARHAGEYTCTASNRAGATSHTAVLVVNGTLSFNVNQDFLFLLSNTNFPLP